jgi:hypothetical protein
VSEDVNHTYVGRFAVLHYHVYIQDKMLRDNAPHINNIVVLVAFEVVCAEGIDRSQVTEQGGSFLTNSQFLAILWDLSTSVTRYF